MRPFDLFPALVLFLKTTSNKRISNRNESLSIKEGNRDLKEIELSNNLEVY
jgi:hypothetical protein